MLGSQALRFDCSEQNRSFFQVPRLASAKPSSISVARARGKPCLACVRTNPSCSRLFKPYEYTDLPFWRKTKRGTSEMVEEINQYCLMYKKLPREFHVASQRVMAEFLFQVNNIEGEGYATFMETMAAVAAGLHSEEVPHFDRRAEAVRCLYQAIVASRGIVADTVPRLSIHGIVSSHQALLGSTKDEIAGRIRCKDGEDAFTKTSIGYYRMFRKPNRVADDLRELVDECNTLLSRAFEESADLKERNEALLKLGGQFFFEFERIHPFKDGNGRIGRVLLAYLLRSLMPFPAVLFVDNGPCLDGFEYPPPFVDREYYIHCFEKSEPTGKQVEIWNHVPVFYNEEEPRPPCDLTALIIEGVYVGWRRFFEMLKHVKSV